MMFHVKRARRLAPGDHVCGKGVVRSITSTKQTVWIIFEGSVVLWTFGARDKFVVRRRG